MRTAEHNIVYIYATISLHIISNKTWTNVNRSFDEAWKINTQNPALTEFMQLLFYIFMDLWQSWNFFIFPHQFACFARRTAQNRANKKLPDKYLSWLCCCKIWRNVLWCPNKILFFKKNSIALFYYDCYAVVFVAGHTFVIILFFVMCEALEHDSMR